MKRTAITVLTALLCLMFSVFAFADNVYYVEDGDDDFAAADQTTTTAPAETTTSAIAGGFENLFGNGDSGTLDSFSQVIGDGFNSLLSGIGSLANGQTQPTTGKSAEGTTSSLSQVIQGEKNHYSSSVTTAAQPQNGTTSVAEPTTSVAAQNTELNSVVVINNAESSDSGISGSTLTLIVFIAAVVILVLVIVIVLVIMTRRTEFNSAVMNKSTIPGVDQPKTLADFMEDDIGDDGNNYSDINYWDDKRGE